MSETKKTDIDDSSLSVTLTVGQLKALVREEVQAVSNGNGHQEGELLSAEAAAKRWNIPKSWISDMARRGELPCVRLGHYIRFKPEDLDRFVKEHRK